MRKKLLSLILISSLLFSCQELLDDNKGFTNDNQDIDKPNNDEVTDLNDNNSPESDTPSKEEDKPSDDGKDDKEQGDNQPDSPSEPDTPSEPDNPQNPDTPSDPGTTDPDEPPEPIENDPSVEPPIDPIPLSDESIDITGIKLLTNTLSMYLGHTYKLAYKTLPENTSQVTTYFKSDIPSIVSVSSDGTLTANKIGKTLITIITGEGYTDRCVVSVIENPNFKFSSPCLDLYINSSKSFSISGSGITYESDNPSVASFSSSGQIQTCGNSGRVILTAKKDNNIAICDLRVFPHNQDNYKFSDIDSTTCSVDGYISNSIDATNLIVPFENSSGKKVVSISNSAFTSSNKRSILLPNSIKSIGNYALAYGEADNFYTPYYLETIGNFAFMNFYFKAIEFNINLKEIGLRAFINCHSFEEMIIPYQTVLRENCFHDCYGTNNKGGLKRVYVQEGATLYSSEKDFFQGCRELTYFNIPTSFTTIPDETFYLVNNALPNGIFIPNTTTSVGVINHYSNQADIDANAFDIFLEQSELPSTYDQRNQVYYLYSKNSPTTSGKFWHYVGGEITKW